MVKKYLDRFCLEIILANETHKYISWPSSTKAATTAAHYLEKFNFPGIVGSIDGTHIPIRAPKEHHNAYINRKGFHSIQLMAIADHNLLFMYGYTGEVGCTHDKRVLTRSGILQQINAGNLLLYFHITALLKQLTLQVKSLSRKATTFWVIWHTPSLRNCWSRISRHNR